MSGILIGVIAGVTSITILGIGLGIGFGIRYLCRTRGDYYTQEDEGNRNADDADTAVLCSKTGLHTVQKKKEWFI
ncbi:cell adhesion molecule 2 [Eurytemora carolleeae]|uniref:cell adhesion molecule 2 n=1 Tax=Eurytemora carolleeae TaxID=1294199 RepID=UPI000C75978A|nr:cell adhesion molecule 2 [Eurytemora carolleeae]|eukprot:XP_023326156.1 cell adhesion molecule 2-like [Eurytemora affinis]